MRSHPDRLTAFDRDSGTLSYVRPLPRSRQGFIAPVSGELYVVGDGARSLSVLTKGRVPHIAGAAVPLTARATVKYGSGPIAVDGSGPITWSLLPVHPDELTINRNTGEVSGTIQVKGTYSYAVQATSPFGSDVFAVRLEVAEPPQSKPGLGALGLSDKPLHHEYINGNLGLTGFPAPKLTVKGLPSGLRMLQSGSIQGTFKKVGKQSFTVTAKNANGATSRKYTISVTGEGSRTGYVLFWHKDLKLDVLAREEIRETVRYLPRNAKITSLEIVGRMYITDSTSTATKKAKTRAYAMARYIRHLGIKTKPTYVIEVGKKKSTESYGYNFVNIQYTYK